jgi:hypothetical protein
MMEKSLTTPEEAMVMIKLESIVDLKLIGLLPERDRRLNP